MEKKKYMLKEGFEYKSPSDRQVRPSYEFRRYINQRKLQMAIEYQEELAKKYS